MNITFINSPNEKTPFLVINKPSGIPSAPINKDDTENALSYAIKKYPQIIKVHGKKEIEYGLLHRIDTVTSGLLLIALNQDFYDYMIIQQEKGLFYKKYKAICQKKTNTKDGFPPCPINPNFVENQEFNITSYFRKYGSGAKEVRPVLQDASKIVLKKTNTNKLYSTNILIKQIKDNLILVECKINKGYRHQVRCHLAWCGLPIKNDNVYNESTNSTIEFKACGLEFFYINKKYSFSID